MPGADRRTHASGRGTDPARTATERALTVPNDLECKDYRVWKDMGRVFANFRSLGTRADMG